ncbi:MAG TPA: NUDIX domain-containing protein [Microthrixaceae bacterium]|jgi:8-oxo-dGTP pyrophosphatase MutT (NUDIX family)|nr:NUDIX domain-containing protein [Microthrixaceae bacterium]
MGFVIRRIAARVVCFDPDGRILLIRSSDPADRSKPAWWELPGGGIDGGETAEHAIARELAEEAGVRDPVIGPCVWTQHAQFTFAGWDFDQHERIHVATCDGDTTGTLHLEAFEALAFEESRWWDPEEFLAETGPTVPPRLREFLPAIIAGDRPDPPIDITPP